MLHWRTFPGQVECDPDHPDWGVAAKAIIERDELSAEVERLTRERGTWKGRADKLLWEKNALRHERDTLRSTLDAVRELCNESFQRDNSATFYGQVHAGELAEIIEKAVHEL